MVDLKFSLVGKITLTSIIIYCLVLSTLEALVVYYHNAFVTKFVLTPYGNGISDSDYIYHSIFILSLVLQVILCLNSLIAKNSIQLVSLVIFNLLSLTYAGVQIYQHIILEEQGMADAYFKPDSKFSTAEDAKEYFVKKMRPIEFVITGLVMAFSIYLGLLTYKLIEEFGWDNYRTYSADLQVRKAFVSLTILQTLVKLDTFFILSYAIQLVPSKLMGYSDSILETALIFVCGFILLLMACISVMKEMKYVLLVVINLCSVSLIYMGYRLYRINIPREVGHDPYEFTRRLLTFTLCATFILVSATIYYGIACFRNMIRGIYVYSAYGPGAGDSTVQGGLNENKSSKRASQIAKVASARTSKLSLD